MNTTTEHYQLDSKLTLHNSSQKRLTVCTISLNFIKQEEQIIECRLTFPVNRELYQRIDKDALFNLKPEIRSPFIGGKFLWETDITIEITLQPDLLPQLLENANNIEQAATYLLNLSQQFRENQENINPLLNTENWLCLSVKQTQNNQEIGYNTFWNYLNPATINNPDKISEGIVNFFQEWTQANLSTTNQNLTTEIINNSISDIFKNFADEIFGETNNNFTNQTMLTTIINFFLEDDWTFTKIEGETSLRLGFQGDNGTWTCYAKVREEQKQFVFYSICPFKVSEDKRLTIAEFITRANYGMINGNFEMDFNDGEIRYKTSIDVDGDKLSFALIKNLVYTNVIMMDEYLPGIINVIENNQTPEIAIKEIEM
ncbi:YbjN domain-containing protein [Anabaena sp. FACHB-1237]|uniref:YbjN domain-containing protein n=1 Tax=Anabaena sp. FACHB-1237 TaxID=2692769 RepID=UPI001680C28B|nr:YbjN domain-containing protein [Anabaena sp. FACHB-1237]MBD2136530.1 YbjN domain-containing protein [Anabaena sp. FACHB-1237]